MYLVSLLFIVILAVLNNAVQVASQSTANPVSNVASTMPATGTTAATATTGSFVTAITNTPTASVSGSNGVDNSLNALPTTGDFGNSVYPGVASFISPTLSKSVLPLYRINTSENVTFIWSFTDLLVQPQTLHLAAVAPNKVTYSIANLEGAATSAVWPLSDVPAASPLMMGTYTIQLYDQRGVSAYVSPGWLQPATTLKIAMYSAESYVAQTTASDYCPLCFYNSARRMTESIGPIGIAFGIATMTSLFILYGLFN